MEHSPYANKMARLLVLVVVMAAVGQMTQTMYVPSIADMASHFSVPATYLQAVMAAYLIPYGLSQFVYGPLSDRIGRRPVVLIGMSIFIVGSIVSLTAPNFELFLVGSFIQGMGTGCSGAMARTVTRDCFEGPMLHKANSMVSMGVIFSPLLAPVLGGLLTSWFDWTATYQFLLIMGIVVTVVMYLFFMETLPEERRQPEKVLTSYRYVLGNPRYQGYLLCLIATFAGIAVYEAAVGVLLGGVLKLDSATVSWLFVMPLPGYFLGSWLSGYLIKYMPCSRMLFISSIALVLGSVVIIVPGMAGQVTVGTLIGGGFLYFLGAGVLFPAATTAAISPFPNHAGTAGAVLGGAQNLGAGVAAMAASFMAMDNQFNLGAIMAVVSTLTVVSLLWVRSQKDTSDLEVVL